MADRLSKGFVFYNSTVTDLTVKVYSFDNNSQSISTKVLKDTYSETINLTKVFKSDSKILFELFDAKTGKSYGSPGILDTYIYSPEGDAYIFDINTIGNILMLSIKDLCFKSISFYNGSLAIVNFYIYKYPPNKKTVTKDDLGKPYWKSPSTLFGQTETIDLTTLNIPDMSLLALRVDATLGRSSIAEIPVIYSNNTFRIAGFKATGTAFSPKLVVNN